MQSGILESLRHYVVQTDQLG